MTGPQPSAADLINHGNRCAETGDLDAAEASFKQASEIDPNSGLAFFGLGTAYYRQEKNAKAIRTLAKAAKLAPDIPEIWNNLGAAFGRARQPDKAISAFKKVCQLKPDHAPAAMNLGRLLFAQGDPEQGERWLRHAADLRPDHGETLRLLADARLAMGQPRLAMTAAVSAVAANPENIDTHLSLGQAYLSLRKLAHAREKFELVLSRRPGHALATYYLAETEEKAGRIEEARALFDQVLEKDLDQSFLSILKLRRALALPVINENTSEINADRTRIENALANLPRPPVDDPYTAGGFTNFYLAYQSRNDRAIQEHVAQFYLDICPDLAAVAPHVDCPRPAGDRYRIGIVSSFLRRHTVGYLSRGLIEHLDRQRFHVTLLRCPVVPLHDPEAEAIAALADDVVDLPDNLSAARNLVASAAADLIYFPEIGMEDLVYFLAFARSAPVQVMGWGHPVTTGIPNMDVFLSVANMEPDNCAGHYSERLQALRGSSLCVSEPVEGSSELDLDSLGVDQNYPIYLCAQSLFKIHPDFDAVIAAILERDPEARVYFISIRSHADDIFLTRLNKSIGDNSDRVRIINRVRSTEFVSLLRAADVLLDVPHWSGGKTSLEGLYAGTPIVHWPGEFMRGRHTLAFYRKMGMTDCVVDSADAYVETAVRLVHDDTFRTSVRSKIGEAAPSLFNDKAAVDEISDVFESLILDSR